MAVAPNQISPQQADAMIVAEGLRVGIDMLQSIASGSITPNGSNNTISNTMRQVGMSRGWLLKITATFLNSGSGQATLTPWGAANLVSNVTVTDLDNYQRVNTTGWHLNMLATAKEGFPFGASLLSTATDSPVKYGNNFSAMSASATLAASGGTGTIQMYYWIPAAYSRNDLRGAIYTGVGNANGFVAFTVNPTPGVTTGDATLACYSGANTNVSITNVTYTLYQNYVDQWPKYPAGHPQAGGPILPPLSIRTQYRLVNTTMTAINPGQDFSIPFTNFQSFLSAGLIYDQNGTLNGGTDLNYLMLQAANTIQLFKVDPITQALRSRIRNKVDWPLGSYMLDFRDAPISTNVAGNMQVVINAITAAAGSQALIGWESFADVQAVLGAQSLPSS